MLCLSILGILLLIAFPKKKPKKKVLITTPSQDPPTVVFEESPNCIPPKNVLVGVIIKGETFSMHADGISNLQSLHESLIWLNQDRVSKLTGVEVDDILECLLPTKEPFFWELDLSQHT